MTCPETQQLLSELKTGKEAKAMYAVDAFSPEEATQFAQIMFERECKGWGDEERAITKLARQCGLSAVSFKRLMKGKRKVYDILLCTRIRTVYLNLCLSLISQLQNDIRTIEEMHGHEVVSGILADVEALEAKTKAAKARIPTAKGR